MTGGAHKSGEPETSQQVPVWLHSATFSYSRARKVEPSPASPPVALPAPPPLSSYQMCFSLKGPWHPLKAGKGVKVCGLEGCAVPVCKICGKRTRCQVIWNFDRNSRKPEAGQASLGKNVLCPDPVKSGHTIRSGGHRPLCLQGILSCLQSPPCGSRDWQGVGGRACVMLQRSQHSPDPDAKETHRF